MATKTENKPIVTEPKPITIRKNIDRNEEITVVSNRTGGLNYVNGTGSVRFRIPAYGVEHFLTFGELSELRNRNKKMIDNADLIIMNDDVIAMWRLESLYATLVMPYDVDTFLADSEAHEIEAKLKGMNRPCQETLYSVAYDKYKNGEFDSTAKQNAFARVLGYNLFKANDEL